VKLLPVELDSATTWGESRGDQGASVNSPLAHGRFLHGASTEDFTVAQKNGPGGRWEQHSGPFERLADVLSAYGGATNVYISPNRFYVA
jgi:hypothetical protein